MSGTRTLLVVFALVALGVVAPGIARADADRTPPALTRLTVPSDVRTGPTAPVVTVNATITDASGIAAGGGAACTPAPSERSAVGLGSSPSGLRYIAPFERLKNDDYRADVVLPRYVAPSTWFVDSVLLADCAGNAAVLHHNDLVAAGFVTEVNVFGLGDTQAPSLADVSFSPATVDNSKAATEVTLTATLHDDLSGVAGGDWETACGPWVGVSTATITPPSGDERQVVFAHLHDDVYSGTLPLRRYELVGTWTLTQVHLVDCAGNRRNLEGPKFLPSRSFTVTGVDDRTPPGATLLTVAPSAVDTRAAGADVVFKARLDDDQTGVAAVAGPCADVASFVTVTAPSGRRESVPLNAIGGDVYDATLRLPRFAEAGTWTVSLQLYDCALNLRALGPAELAAAGLASSFTVLPSLYDFGGFMNPLDPGAIAQRNAGSAMAVKFRLGGAHGLSIFDAGFPAVQPIDCATRQPTGAAVPLNDVEWRFQELVEGLYHYKWKSSPDWHDVCRRLTLGFDDGSRYSADVHFS